MKTEYSIVAGVYVLSTNNSACIVDAVEQVSAGDNPLVAVSVNKSNFTNKMLSQSDKFAISILPQDVDGEIIKTFGFNSSRNINKFENIKYKEVDGLKVLAECIGYMTFEKINEVDCDTHTLFIGRLIKEERYNNKEELVYQYYQKNKEKYIKIQVNKQKTVWVCNVCGYVYESEELPDNYKCPLCGAGKENFSKQEK